MDNFKIGGDLQVGRLGFGAMRITGDGIWGPPDDPDEARAVLRRVLDLGLNLIDTADSYGPDVSEELIAEALHPYPEQLVIATKGGPAAHRPRGVAPRRAAPSACKECCEGSLRRLKVDRIDLYQLHAPDPEVPFADSWGRSRSSRTRARSGTSACPNVSTGELAEAREIVEVVTVQNRFNLEDRDSEDVLDVCAEEGIGFIPWFPLATGGSPGPGARWTRWRRATTHHRARWRWPGCSRART